MPTLTQHPNGLSGSHQGAGGVGGVLAVTIATNGVHFTSFDGNGNISALVGATSGTATANYDYSPFGVMLRAEGVVAKANPIRWSTQFMDDVMGTAKYLFRDYQPRTGQWLNRDPIGEWGGPNIYAFVYNNPVRWIDYLGREIVFEGDDKLKDAAGKMLAAAKGLANAELKKKIAEIEADKFACKLKLVFGSKTVIVGNYQLETIDLGDIEKFPESGGAATRAATFVHELIEQWEKQKNNKPYLVAHAEGMKAEFSVTGNVRGAQGTAAKNADGSFSIPIYWKQKIKSKITKDGVETTEEKTIDITQTLTILDGNIVKVETVEKK